MVEVDETFIGGAEKFKHKSKKKKKIRGYGNRSIVFSTLERQGSVWTTMVKRVTAETLKPIIRARIDKSNVIVTDGFGSYNELEKEYKGHEVVNHEQGEYVNGEFHTNTIEGFFSQLKRGIYGIYHSVSPKHLQKYCDEFCFRYNTRESSEEGRFNYAFLTCNSRLKYKDLISNKILNKL